MQNSYSIYGLTIDSEIPLPELRPSSGEAEVRIILGEVPVFLQDTIIKTPGYMANHTATLVKLDSTARCLAIEGHTLVVEPVPGVDERSLRTFLLNTALVALLQQRPALVLQASAIRWGDGAILFAGSGAVGKSTLAALFSDQGCPVVSDEIAMITADDHDRPIVQPGYPALKLWLDTIMRLKSDWPEPRRLRPGIGKRIVRAPARFSQHALPVLGIIILGHSVLSGIHIQPLRGTERFSTVAALADRLKGISETRLRALRFRLAGALTRLSVFYRVEWSPREERLDDLRMNIEDLLAVERPDVP